MQAVRIMTGAQLPKDCDAVIMFEMVQESKIDNRSIIELNRTIQPDDNISLIGEDTKKGTVLVSKGTYINPGVVAVLATFGYKNVPVSKKPIIGVIATGSELLDVDEELQRSEEHTSELQSRGHLVCRLLPESNKHDP